MLAKERMSHEREFRPSVKIAAALMVVMAAGIFFEATARVVYIYRDDIRSNLFLSNFFRASLDLDPYEMPSPRGGYHWVLRPGYKATTENLIAAKKKSGRTLGAGVLRRAGNGNDKEEEVLFRINKQGFKGPELAPLHNRPRILALGDSTTFGTGVYDYPRFLSDSLNGRGIPVEVINGGVEGYSPRNILFEMDRYKALKPEIVILYIGWNALFSYNPWPDALENKFRIVWLINRTIRSLRAVLWDPRAHATKLFNRKLYPDPTSSDVESLNGYTPPFLDKVELILEGFKSIGTEVVLVTLPGLFVSESLPSSKAMKIGHLPYFTDNPFVLAKLMERYNAALRALKAGHGGDILDLERWSADTLRPREDYFSDSVHLNPQGLELIGVFMADQLAKRVLNKQ